MTVHLEDRATSTKVGHQAVATAVAWDVVLVLESHLSLCLNHNEIYQEDKVDDAKQGRNGTGGITGLLIIPIRIRRV